MQVTLTSQPDMPPVSGGTRLNGTGSCSTPSGTNFPASVSGGVNNSSGACVGTTWIPGLTPGNNEGWDFTVTTSSQQWAMYWFLPDPADVSPIDGIPTALVPSAVMTGLIYLLGPQPRILGAATGTFQPGSCDSLVSVSQFNGTTKGAISMEFETPS
ncbi:MAG TPA: hypothetical protein VFZ97_20085 [Acidimicrobiales bacterium]